MNLEEYQRLAHSTAIYPPEQAISYITLGLTGEAGEVANQVKKALRDDSGKLSDERREALIKEFGDVLWYLSEGCTEIGISLDYVARKNLEKLSSRHERGTLSGSGDER